MSTRALIRGTEMPSLFDDFLRPWNEWFDGGRSQTMPSVNIIENKDNLSLSLAAPGLKKEDFKIDLTGNLLTISAEKDEKKEEKGDWYSRKEYNYSSFSRSFTIPEDVNKEKIDATYVDGVLKLILPKKEEA